MRRRKFLQLTTVALASSPTLARLMADQQKTKEATNYRESIINASKEIIKNKSPKIKILYPEGCLSNINPIVRSFQEKTNVAFEFAVTSVDTINSNILLNAASDSYQFDVAIPATFGIPDLVESNALADLTSFRAKHQSLEQKEGMLYSTGDYYKGKFYGYQTDGDAYLMFYNKAWLEDEEESKRFADSHGYPLAVPKTWEELDAMMAFFHRPEKGQYGGCLFRTADYIAWEWWIRLHAKGVYPLLDDMTPNFNRQEGISALEELIKATEFQHPSSRTNGLFDNWEIYGQGTCFANIGWGGTQKHLRSNSQMRENLAFGMTPGGKQGDEYFNTPYFNWGWNYVVSRFSPHQELAYLFTLYASTPELSSLAVRQPNGYFDPYRSEHYEDKSIKEAYGRPFLDTHRKSMTQCIPDFYISNYIDYFGALKENLMLALNGALTPKVALDITAKQWEKITENSGRENQSQQWQFLKSLYPKNTAKFLEAD